MNLKGLMIVNAIIALGFAVAFLIVPGPLFSMYGITSDLVLEQVARLLAAAFVVFAIVLWKVRESDDAETQMAIKWAFFTGHSIGFIVSLYGQLNNVTNTLGWSTVVLYLLLAVGFAYFLFLKGATDDQQGVLDAG